MMLSPLLLATMLLAAPISVDPASPAAPSDAPGSVPIADAAAPDLIDVAIEAGSFNTLAAALQAAGLVDALRGDGPFTVFAPTDEAFERLPAGTVESLLEPGSRDALTSILTYHVIPGRVTAVEAITAGSAVSLLGEPLAFRIEDGGLRVGDARIRSNDIQARNGVIHVIDAVLLPPQPEAPATLGPYDILALAIDRGVPLFNDGQPAACAALYELGCRAVLDLGAGLISADTAGYLRRGLDEAAQESHPSLQAWALRRGMDRAMLAMASSAEMASTTELTSSVSSTPRLRDAVIFDFDRVRPTTWPSVNDDVMGGISRGSSRRTDSGTFLFLGSLSLENNGGFSTVRSRAENLDLAGWDGLVLRVRGDGRTYNFSALTNDSPRELHYWEEPFETVADEWIEVKIPFDALSHRVMGWTLPDGPIDPATIRSLAFGISDKNTMPFALEVDWIKAYRAG